MDRFNRILWTLLALILTAAGLFGALASQGVAGVDTGSPVLWNSLLRYWRDQGDAAPWTLAGTGVLGAVLGVVLIATQLRRPGGSTLSDLTLPQESENRGRSRGVTTIAASALRGGLARDLEALPEITRAHVRLTGDPEDLHLHAAIRVHADTDLEEFGSSLQSRLERFTLTSGLGLEDVALAVVVESTVHRRVR